MGKMKAYANFDEYLEAQSPKNQAIIRALRRFVKRIEPKVSEAVKWGNGVGSEVRDPSPTCTPLRSMCNLASFTDPP